MQNHPSKFILTLSAAMALTVSQAWADSPLPCGGGPLLNLSTSSSEEVQNDQVRMNWMVQFERTSAAEAMAEANRVLLTSIQSLEKNSHIKNLRNNIQTYPQYNRDGQTKAWVAQGSLSFEMPLEALKGKGSVELSAPMALSNIQYFVSPAKSETSVKKLTQQAIAEFQQKAQDAATGFGHKGYTVNQVNIQDERAGMAPVPMMARMYASADMSSKNTELATSGGSSNLSVSVNGNVCLRR